MSLNISGISQIYTSQKATRNLELSNEDLDGIEHLIGQNVTKENIEQKLKESKVSGNAIEKIMASVKSLPDDIDTISFAIIRKDIPEKRRQDMRDILSNNEQDIAKNEEISTAEFEDLLDPENEKEETERLLFPDGDDSLRPESLAIRQGKEGDCYFLAPLLSLSNSREGRESIKKMMEVQNDGSVIVRFPGAKTDKATRKPIEIQIPKPQVDENGSYDGAQGARRQHNGTAIWGQVLEKAFFAYKRLEGHQYNDSIGIHNIQGPPHESIQLLTNKKVQSFTLEKLKSTSQIALILKHCLSSDEVVTAISKKEADNEQNKNGYELAPEHVYSIVGFTEDNPIGNSKVLLRNPWGGSLSDDFSGSNCVFEISLDEFKKRFEGIALSIRTDVNKN